MRSTNEHTRSLEDESYRELRLLEEVDGNPDLSQRRLAHRLGIALGVANLLVRNGAKRGYIRVIQLGWKRWAYVITPKGMTRKLYLTVGYIERFVNHYRRVRRLLYEDLSDVSLNPESRVAIVGTSDLAELAYLALKDIGVEEIEVFDLDTGRPKFLGMRVQSLKDVEPRRFSRFVVTAPGDEGLSLKSLLAQGVEESQVVQALQSQRPSNDAAGQSEEAS